MLNKRLGQHFLRDQQVIEQIIAAIAPAAADTIIEIGPGNGALTDRLQSSGARLIALEVDKRFADILQKRYAHNARARILHANALHENWQPLLAGGNNGDSGNSNGGGEAKARLAGNLPYNISAPLLLKMARCAHALHDCHVMVQKEVGARVCAAPGGKEYGRLTVQMQLSFHAQQLFIVPPGAFMPPPLVDSAVLRLTPLPTPPPLPPCFQGVLAAAFGKRRKTLKNALSAFAPSWQSCGIDAHRRAEELSPQEFIALARACENSTTAAD